VATITTGRFGWLPVEEDAGGGSGMVTWVAHGLTGRRLGGVLDARRSRLREAVELHEVGVALMRKNLERRHPELDGDGVDELLRAWLRDRPPDAPGTSRPTLGHVAG
jgi:hypothetical protein